MSSPSSSSSSSSQGGRGGAGESSAAAAARRRRGGRRRRGRRQQQQHEYEGPSSTRRRALNEVWPEHFVEALAVQVALDAARSLGRLAAAEALANIFQVCTTWRAVSRSELLWHRLTRRVWGRTHLFHRDTWRDEYIFWHRTAANFRTGQCSHAVLHFDPSDNGGAPPPNGGAPVDPDALTCRCLTLSDNHLACGFADGAVRLFDLATRLHVRTLRSRPRNVLGRFSRAVTGIVLVPDRRVVFATLDGDVHVAVVDAPQQPRRAHGGHVVEDGVLVDFAGNARWWVGLYAGAPGRAFHVWDGASEELLFVGGSLTDPESVTGWQMLIELTLVVGRVRVMGHDTAVACTGGRSIVFDLRDPALPLAQEDRGLLPTSLAVSPSAYVVADRGGAATVRRSGTLEEVCRFRVRRAGSVMGSMNRGYVLMCAGGSVRVWESETGVYRYRLGEELGEVNALAADERHVAACANDATLHLWDFGPL